MNVYTLHLLLNNLRSSYFYCHCQFTSNYQTFSFKVCLVEDERHIACFNGNPSTAQPSFFQIAWDLVCLNREGSCNAEGGQIDLGYHIAFRQNFYWNKILELGTKVCLPWRVHCVCVIPNLVTVERGHLLLWEGALQETTSTVCGVVWEPFSAFAHFILLSESQEETARMTAPLPWALSHGCHL